MSVKLSELNISQLAELTHYDRATVRKKLGDLAPVRKEAKATYYDSYKALKLLFGDSDKSADKRRADELVDQNLRYEQARADKTILEVQKMRGELIHIADVAKVVSAEYTNVRTRILSIGSRCAQDLANESKPALVKERIDEEINEALAELSADKKFEENGYVEQSTGDTGSDSTEDPPSAPKADTR